MELVTASDVYFDGTSDAADWFDNDDWSTGTYVTLGNQTTATGRVTVTDATLDINTYCLVASGREAYGAMTLNGAGSTTTGGTITGYLWRFGEMVVSTDASFSIPMPLGVYTFTLTATGTGGWTDSDEVVVTVREPSPAMPGDCDGDDDVDLDDFVILKNSFGATAAP